MSCLEKERVIRLPNFHHSYVGQVSATFSSGGLPTLKKYALCSADELMGSQLAVCLKEQPNFLVSLT